MPPLVPSSDIPMASWVQEKILSVLEEFARIADIAKDPKTPDWYKRNLRQSIHPGIRNALKVLLWSAGRDDWSMELAQRPTEHGTLGLAVTLNDLGIAHQFRVDEPTIDPDDNDRQHVAEVAEIPKRVPHISPALLAFAEEESD